MIEVINNLEKNVENVALTVTFKADGVIPEVDTAAMMRGDNIWIFDGQDDDTLYFFFPNDLDLDDNEEVSMNLYLKVVFLDGVGQDITFEAKVEIMD